MNFDHDIGLISSLLTIDTTIAPPLGGQVDSLEVIGTGSLILPQGTTLQRPSSPVTGMLRYNATTNFLEYYDNTTTWVDLSAGGGGSGTVTSIDVTGSTGISTAGGPVTTSGTITLTLSTELQGLSGLATNGFVVRTGTGTYANRSITGTAGNISIATGDGVAGNPVIDLIDAGTPVTTAYVKITTDSKGRVTATTPVVASDITTLIDSTYVNVAGDTMSSAANLTFSGGGEVLGLPTTPSNATAAVSKAYVDNLAQGLDPKPSVRAATTAPGVLATDFVAGSVVGGVTVALNDRILVKDQAAPEENGIRVVAISGAPARAVDMDIWTEVPNAYLFVEEGSLADTGWVCTSNAGGTIDVTAITFAQFSGVGTYTVGAGLTLSGNQFSLTIPVVPAYGGTGTVTVPTAGQVLIGTSGGVYAPAVLTQGIGITITSGSGSIAIANAGVTSITGTANQITASASTGAVTLSLPSSVTIGTLTLSSLTANTFLYSDVSKIVTSTAAPTNGQLLIGSTGAAPVVSTITPSTGISIVNGAGTITISNTGVTSIVAGTGINISSGTGAVTISNTGVTSVALALPSIFTVSGSPVTTTGTLTGTLNAQTANTFFSGPLSSTAVPTFRTITYADLTVAGALALYRENSSTPTTPVASGTNAIAIGNGATASGTNGIGFGSGSDARTYGMKAFANGDFTNPGDAQGGLYVMRNVTTNATPTELYLDGASATQRLVLATNSVYTFSILVAARRTDATGGGAGYRVEGAVRKDTTAGSTTIIGTASKSILGETNVGWDVVVDADTTNGSLRVTVTGEAAKTIQWVATIQTSEVRN